MKPTVWYRSGKSHEVDFDDLSWDYHRSHETVLFLLIVNL